MMQYVCFTRYKYWPHSRGWITFDSSLDSPYWKSEDLCIFIVEQLPNSPATSTMNSFGGSDKEHLFRQTAIISAGHGSPTRECSPSFTSSDWDVNHFRIW